MLILLSDDGHCARETHCLPLRAQMHGSRAKWAAKHRLLLANWGGEVRSVALVGVRDEKRKIRGYLMDCITGSLFSLRTLSIAASNQRLSNVKRDQRKATKLLVNYVTADKRGW